MKIIKNTCWGGFGLSQKAYQRLIELGVPLLTENRKQESFHLNKWNKKTLAKWKSFGDEPIFCHRNKDEIRTNPLVIQVVEELGAAANGRFAKLEIVEIPNDIEWVVDQYDGIETIHEAHE